MSRKPRRQSGRSAGGSSRRGFLLLLLGGTGAAVGVGGRGAVTGAFSTVKASRTGNFSVASQENAVIGVVNQGPVKKNTQESMIELANNRPDPTDITVSLDTCSDGTLYDNADGESGCSVVVSLDSGNAQFVDIEAAVTGTIPFSISINDPDFSFSTSGTIDSESGNNPDTISIEKPAGDNDFKRAKGQGQQADPDYWEAVLRVEDIDGDNDLETIEIEVSEGGSNGTTVATKEIAPPDGAQYGQTTETIYPDDSTYGIKKGQQYTLNVKAIDADGNFDTQTVQDTDTK